MRFPAIHAYAGGGGKRHSRRAPVKPWRLRDAGIGLRDSVCSTRAARRCRLAGARFRIARFPIAAQAAITLAAREEVDLVVVGIPEGSEDDRQASICRRLADEIRARGLEVHLVDESLTSVEAHSAMRQAGMRAADRRRRVDGESACRILDRYFDGLAD